MGSILTGCPTNQALFHMGSVFIGYPMFQMGSFFTNFLTNWAFISNGFNSYRVPYETYPVSNGFDRLLLRYRSVLCAVYHVVRLKLKSQFAWGLRRLPRGGGNEPHLVTIASCGWKRVKTERKRVGFVSLAYGYITLKHRLSSDSLS